tara:strand:+ start:356 stop:985 length:630 start_codon:yes stop_codon:yes gene_type:complete
MKKKLNILQTNLSNLQSIEHAVSALGHKSKKISKIDQITSNSILIIPGVGNFKQAIKNIGSPNSSIDKILNDKSIKIFGICLGMQLLFSESEEGGSKGLDLIPGTIDNLNRFGVKKIPNIGWKKVNFREKELERFNDEYFYFVHSYAANPKNEENIVGVINLENRVITSMVSNESNQIGNYIGCQFHPEKSGEIGLKFLDKIISILDSK